MKMRQAEIRNGNIYEKCWLNDCKKLKVGKFVTLKDEDDGKKWEILSLSNECVDKETLYKPWKVGGLN